MPCSSLGRLRPIRADAVSSAVAAGWPGWRPPPHPGGPGPGPARHQAVGWGRRLLRREAMRLRIALARLPLHVAELAVVLKDTVGWVCCGGPCGPLVAAAGGRRAMLPWWMSAALFSCLLILAWALTPYD